jgi:hypothetical protein
MLVAAIVITLVMIIAKHEGRLEASARRTLRVDSTTCLPRSPIRARF